MMDRVDLEDEVLKLRKQVDTALDVLDSLATDPKDLNDGYDHYKACRAIAKLAAKHIRAMR